MRRIILALSIALAWLGVARAEQAAAPTTVTGDTIAAKIAETLAARIPVAGRYHVSFADPAFALTLPAAAQKIPYQFALAYAVLAGVLLLLSFTKESREPATADE